MTDTAYKPIEAGQKTLRVVLALAGNEFEGLAVKQICEATGLSPSMAGNYLETLRVEGLAEKIEETQRWRLGPKLVQVAIAFSAHINKKKQQLDDIENRYTRHPR